MGTRNCKTADSPSKLKSIEYNVSNVFADKNVNVKRHMRETGRSAGQMQDGLMMLSFNCRSIRNKVTELTSKLDELDIDVCMLQETWLSRGDESVIAEIKDHGFEILSKRRTTCSRGGGVAVLYKTFINVRMLKRKENYTSFEYMIFTITAKYKLIRVINN